MPLDEQITLRIKLTSFLKTLWLQTLLFVILLFIFGILFFLSRTPMSIYWYGVQLSVFFYLLVVGIQWFLYLSKLKRATLTQSEEQKGDLVERIYQQKYKNQSAEFREFRKKESEKSQEQMDYFSLWLHQIKTPIAAISLILQQNKALSSESQRQMEQELLRLNEYTHMALNYLKLEDAGKELDLEWVSIDEVIKYVLKKYSILFIYNKIQLDYQPVNKPFLTDRVWLQVLIEQILSNSLKYTKTGKISIYLKSDYTLVIEDTGAGIRQEDLPKIFEKGYTGLNGRLHEKSTGLGLFLSKKICGRLGHGLQIESEIGTGTKVYIDFGQTNLQVFD